MGLILVIVAGALVGGYLLASRASAPAGVAAAAASGDQSQFGVVSQQSNPTTLAQLRGGGGGPSTSSIIGTSSGFAQAGTSLAAGLGLIKAGGEFAKAVPIVGSIIGIGLSVYSMISQHHKAALAAEGKALNDATPRAMETFVLIVQATIRREITSLSQAQSLVQQTIDLWYGEVQPVQRGVWHYRGYQNLAQFIGSNFAVTFAQHPEVIPPDPFDDKAGPNPCNGACSLGHFFLERRGAIVLQVVSDILAGRHGTMVFAAVPAHETQQGYPETKVTY